MPSRHARSHAGFGDCAFADVAIAGIAIAHMATHATAEIADERAAIHRIVFKFIPLLEIPTGLAGPTRRQLIVRGLTSYLNCGAESMLRWPRWLELSFVGRLASVVTLTIPLGETFLS
jgi:hypothetical protein